MDWRLFLKVLVVSIFISGAVASLFLYPIQDAGDVAAWVQAVGSIAAIFGATWIARREYQRALRSERRQLRLFKEDMARQRMQRTLREISKLTSIEHICEGLLRSLESCAREIETEGAVDEFALWYVNVKWQIDECIKTLDKAPIHEPPYSYLAFQVTRVKMLTHEVLTAVDAVLVINYPPNAHTSSEFFKRVVSLINSNVPERRKALKEIINSAMAMLSEQP